MISAKQALLLLAVVVGIWGCAPGVGGKPSPADRLRALEIKNEKLEEDFRAVAATRDQLRKQLAAAEELQQQLQEKLATQVQELTRERDELRLQVTARTGERDALVGQFEQFRKNIRELLGQAEASMPRYGDHPVTSAVEAVVPKS